MKRFLILTMTVIACSSTPEKSTAGEAKAPEGPKALEHEKCEASMGRAETLDPAKSGKPELIQVFDKSNGHEMCRVADLNHDGKPDMYEYYNADGTLRRREGAYETSDAISEVQTFENGKMVRRERDTTGQRKIDTWDTYDPATGKLIKRERDNNGDGKVDQWWTWDGNNVTIAIDKNGDGQPDPDQSITVGPNGQAITPPSPSASASATGDAGAGGGGATLPPPPPPPVLYNNQPTLSDAGAPKKKPGAKK